MNKKDTIPVMSGGAKFLGLTQPELTINLLVFSFYLFVFSMFICIVLLIIQIVLIISYVQFFAKLDENFFYVARNNLKIPSVVYGHITRPVPILRNKLSKYLGPSNK